MNDDAHAKRGADALALLKNRQPEGPPSGLLDKISRAIDESPRSRPADRRFWAGTAFGGAVAATLIAVILFFTAAVGPVSEVADVAEFTVAVGEPRIMDLAIETDRALHGVTISIMLFGSVELEGYPRQRELSWTSDLEPGVNRLSLPVMAIAPDGGQMVVRMSHPNSEQVFVVRLPAAT